MNFSFTSSGKDAKKIARLGAGLLAGGCVCLVVASLSAPVKIAFQALFALFVLAALFVWIRFLLLTYRYEVINDGDDYFFQIVQVQKLRQTTLLQFEAKNILEIRRYEQGKKPGKKEYSCCYVYNTAIFSPTAAIFVKTGDRVAAVVLEADEEFLSKLSDLRKSLCRGAAYDPAQGEQFENNEKTGACNDGE